MYSMGIRPAVVLHNKQTARATQIPISWCRRGLEKRDNSSCYNTKLPLGKIVSANCVALTHVPERYLYPD